MTVSSHSIVDSSVTIGERTTIGSFCVLEKNVQIGEGCQIGHHVVIHEGTVIGNGVRIDDHTTIGKQPMRSPNSVVTSDRLQPPATIGDDTLIGASVVIYAGCTLNNKILVADLATIREEVTVGGFTIVGRGVAIENKCTIGRYCKLETNVYVTAYSTLEDRVFLAPGVLTSNDNFVGRTKERFKHFKGVTVQKGGRLGVGSVTLPGVTIAPDTLVAAGALITKNTDPDHIYAGIPARKFRPVPDEQKLNNQGWEDA